MILAAFDADTAYLVSGTLVAAGSVGAWFGRQFDRRLKARQAQKADITEMRTALVGAQATDFHPAEKGLIELVHQLATSVERLDDRMNDHMDHHP